MAKTKISEFSATPGNNTDIDGINLAEGCAPSGINDAIRELMAQLKDFQAGTAGDSFNGPVGTTTAAAGAFTTLTTSGAVTHNGGTANGVAYLNGSKVLTTGSALTFDGALFANYSTGGAIRKGNAAATVYTGLAEDGVYATGTDLYLFAPSSRFISFYANGSEQMRLTSTGLGIGTSSPGYKLDVSATGTTVSSAFRSDQSEMWMMLKDSGTTLGHVRLGSASGAMLFYSGNSTRATLDASGNLGLGVTPSAWGSGYTPIQGSGYSLYSGNTVQMRLSANEYFSSTASTYRVNGAAALYQQSAGVHSWHYAPSGTAGNAISFTQAMTLDASGNLAVGTTSPSTRLHAKGSGGTIATFERDASGTIAYFNRNAASGNAGAIIGADSVAGYFAGGNNTNNMVYLDSVNNLAQFYTNATERARIDSSGNLLVGTQSQPVGGVTARLAVSQSAADYSSVLVSSQTTAANCYGARIQYTGAAPNGTGNAFLVMLDTGGDRAIFRSNGGLANYSANDVNLSDRREKTNFAPAGEYLTKICAIPVQTFNYIDQNMEEDPGLTLGVVAQDVQAVAPELVMESNWGTEEEPKMRLSIYQTDLQYALMKCIQEQQAIITDLRARVAALEAA